MVNFMYLPLRKESHFHFIKTTVADLIFNRTDMVTIGTYPLLAESFFTERTFG